MKINFSARLEKLQRLGVQLSERLTPLFNLSSQLRNTHHLKPLRTITYMGPRDVEKRLSFDDQNMVLSFDSAALGRPFDGITRP